jgi:hypothetical protein
LRIRERRLKTDYLRHAAVRADIELPVTDGYDCGFRAVTEMRLQALAV